MASDIHPLARQGFQAATDAYEHGRPEYPDEAIACLVEACGIQAGTRVVELGAGTGKFTRSLIPIGARILAVEPVEAMRKKFAEMLPGTEILAGSAEHIPLADGSADVVLAAQAFHWFDAEKTLAECRRVLKTGGRLGLIWNLRDESIAWVSELARILDACGKDAPRYKSFEWKKAFEEPGFFGPLHSRSFTVGREVEREAFLDAVASISFVAAMTLGDRSALLGKVRDLIDKHGAARGQAPLDLLYKTDVYWCRRA